MDSRAYDVRGAPRSPRRGDRQICKGIADRRVGVEPVAAAAAEEAGLRRRWTTPSSQVAPGIGWPAFIKVNLGSAAEIRGIRIAGIHLDALLGPSPYAHLTLDSRRRIAARGGVVGSLNCEGLGVARMENQQRNGCSGQFDAAGREGSHVFAPAAVEQTEKESLDTIDDVNTDERI